MIEFRRLGDDFYVAPQLRPEDFPAAKAAGIRTIINNRPDGESPDQMSDAEARAAASTAGLTYVHVPVPGGGLTRAHLEQFRAAVDSHAGPFLAYCRSGTRSCYLWAFTAVRELPVSYVLAAAAEAGYDLGPAEPALEATRRADRTHAGQ
jgi:sulfide:quinone oxidoreductase